MTATEAERTLFTGAGPQVDAVAAGRLAALVVDLDRDLADCAAAYADLYPDPPFEPSLFTKVAQAIGGQGPWHSAAQLRISNRTSAWIFALDWIMDHAAGSLAEIHDTVARCLAVGDGDDPAPGDRLGQFLAELRDVLAATPAWSRFGPVWREELRLMLEGMAREWEWKDAHARGEAGLPTYERYLDNADNFGSVWGNVAHWMHVGAPATLDHMEPLREVSRQAQKVLRLLNDLATWHRDRAWGDLNALMLGVDPQFVIAHITALTEHCHRMLEPLRDRCPQGAVFVARQLGYSTGYYGSGADYWGALGAERPRSDQ
ncbi:hypothetical protein SAMN04489712_102357 [Thermomonospora echinospora]|uniref:Terpene synthase family, metal binding domain n=1 Tax=Thermomonospora echinospora TaxID=1992 RepID=A0A1H5VKS5_9ACTN|nr:terpene synthase family protein [Thermomonospora echinospora]SEF87820.1 hypothetical protein SAMN04489712_102357 [Thermomonospora echinospora]